MKYKIEKKDGKIRIYDNNGNEVYWENSNGDWIKRKFDNDGNCVYWKDSDGYWVKKEFDNKGNWVYWENSDGYKWGVDPDKNIIEAKDLDECLKKLKEKDLK